MSDERTDGSADSVSDGSADSSADRSADSAADGGTDEATAASALDAGTDGAAGAPSPRVRPTSAASRARRIGGGTTPRPTTERPTDRPGARAGAVRPAGKTPPVAVSTSKNRPERDVSRDGDRSVQVSLPAWVTWVPAAAFLLAAVAVLAFFVADRVGSDGGVDVSQKERQQVLAAAKTCVAAMNTYRYTDLDAYEKAGTRCTTGRLTSQFQKTVNTLIRKAAPTQRFTQTAQINLAGIEDVSSNGKQWSVLVYGQLNITNKGTGKQGRVDPFSVVATMEKHSGRWVIARVQLLSSIGD